MGDVGSLGLGGALGLVALLIKQEFLLVFVGGVFVIEALSVIIQVASFKLTGKRVFRMAPLHHHFELRRLERVESDLAIPDRRDRVRAVRAHHVEAAMTTTPFSVIGKRVVVAGAARSGIAAAHLLVRRGARVTLSRRPAVTAGVTRARSRRDHPRARRPHAPDFHRRRSDRDEPGRAAAAAGDRRGTRRRRHGHR